MSAIIIDDKIIHYEVLGRGKPIVFLHGWVGSWRYWIPTMQSASTSYRAYAIDLWGFGESAKEAKNYTLEKQTELLDYFLNDMGIAKVALVGHGLGAVVAMLYAAKHNFVVDRIMGVGLPLFKNDLTDKIKPGPDQDFVAHLLEKTAAPETASADATKADSEAIKASIEDLKYISLLDISKQLETASLLVHGQKDQIIDPPELKENGELPHTIHQITFDESGHFPMLEQPNKFHRLMNDFLDLASGDSPQQLSLKDEWKRRVR